MILDKLNDNGFSAFIVGGALRNTMLNIPVNDWDIATSAKPNEVMEVFKNFDIIPTGLQHGTVTINIDDVFMAEVTTFRVDGKYTDGRRPDNVEFTTNIIEDLKRRDFTINAMAFNDRIGLIDPFHGRKDIRNKTIRCVGNPYDRFNEDALRILRAIRFAAQLEFDIEDDTSDAIHNLKDNLNNISRERINNELCKILNSNRCGCMMLARYIDVINTFIPEAKVFFSKRSIMRQLNSWVPCSKHDDIVSRLALLFYDLDPDKVEQQLLDLRFSKLIALKTAMLVDYLSYPFEYYTDKLHVRCLTTRINDHMMKRLIFLFKCFANANQKDNPEQLQDALKFEWLYNVILENEKVFEIKDLAINGYDIMNLGVKQGSEIGRILDNVFDAVTTYEIDNDKDMLIQYIEKELL